MVREVDRPGLVKIAEELRRQYPRWSLWQCLAMAKIKWGEIQQDRKRT